MPAVMSRNRSRRRNAGRGSSVSMPPQCRSQSSVGKAAQPLGTGRAADPELDGGEGFPEAGRRAGEHGLGPRRRRCHAEHAGAPGAGGIDGPLGGFDLGEDAPGALHSRGPERGRAHAKRQALEQQAAEALLEPGDVAGERGLGDVRALRGRTDRARLGDGKEPEQVRSSLEHGVVPRVGAAGRMFPRVTCGGAPAAFKPSPGARTRPDSGDGAGTGGFRRGGRFAIRAAYGFCRKRHFHFARRAANRIGPWRGARTRTGGVRRAEGRVMAGSGRRGLQDGGRHVVVVESPAKARTIGAWLGPSYRVMATRGHVRDLPARAGSVDPGDGFSMVYETGKAAARTLGAIAKALARADILVLATDPDREGEAIAWQVLSWLAERDAVGDRPVLRVVFHEVTPAAVRRALIRPRAIDMDLVRAWQARRALDYLVGYSLSPVLWRKLPGCRSAGRVQIL